MRRWFTGRVDPVDPLLAADELAAMEDATLKASWVMNDEVEKAQAELAKGTSPFHKLGYGASLFWQGVLGFNKEIMDRAAEVIYEAEVAAADHHRMVVRDHSTGHQSKIYPAGSEYLLCQAHCQMLGAVLGIQKESWTESLAGLNKLRKGYFNLQAISDAEKKYIASNPLPTTSKNTAEVDSTKEVAQLSVDGQSDPGIASSIKSGIRPGLKIAAGDSHVDFRAYTKDPIDLFIHSGLASVWGIIKLSLSILPPGLRHILSLFSFRGDRLEGLQLLWDAADYKDNIFGCIGALVVLLYNHIGVALADIVSEGAIPEAKLKTLLGELRTMYPDSQLWLNELARGAAVERDLDRAMEVLSIKTNVHFQAIQGLAQFERALDLMFLHRFEESSEAFLKCTQLNKWNHSVYYYNAAACQIELYRDLRESNPEKAKSHAEKAKELLGPVPALAQQKFIMGQHLPFDIFIGTKLKKWQARAVSAKCDLVDAVGVSPLEEMAYFWTGYRRMQPHQLQVSLDRLEAGESRSEWADEGIDELAGQALLKAAALRGIGKFEQAKKMIEDQVLCYTSYQIKSCPHATDYALPVAHYELAVCLWEEGGKDNASPDVLQQCREQIDKSSKLERFSLEERMTIKLLAARTTLTSLGA